MSIVDSIVKAVNDNIDQPRITAMIDIVKEENSSSASEVCMSFARMLDTDILESVRIIVFQQHILFEAYVKNDQQRFSHHALQNDDKARKQLAERLYELEEKYGLPCSLDVNLYPACLIWHIDGKKHTAPLVDNEA